MPATRLIAKMAWTSGKHEDKARSVFCSRRSCATCCAYSLGEAADRRTLVASVIGVAPQCRARQCRIEHEPIFPNNNSPVLWIIEDVINSIEQCQEKEESVCTALSPKHSTSGNPKALFAIYPYSHQNPLTSAAMTSFPWLPHKN